MTLEQASQAIIYKFPQATYSIHADGDTIVFDAWSCGIQEQPSQETLQIWYDELIASQDYLVTHFDQRIFFGRLIQEFAAARWTELSKLGIGWTMQQLIMYPNFPGLKTYLADLVSDETVTADDYNIIDACLKEQGIDLGDF